MTESTLDVLVTALCLDYQRRKEVIESRSASHRTENELRYYNFKIYEAAAEVVGEEMAALFISEIGNRRGYAYSEVCNMSESTYKIKKRAVRESIAKKLHLTD